jgi:hypothetical protein
MKPVYVFAVCLLLASIAMAQEPSAMGEFGSLRLLYAGHPGSAREADFVKFLKEYFKTVDTDDLATFKESGADGYDVVLFDYDGDGFKAPQPKLSQDYARSTVTLGVVGAFICGSLGLKPGYI